MMHLEPPTTPPTNDLCEWHPDLPKADCPECQAEHEAWEDHLVDLYREERAS